MAHQAEQEFCSLVKAMFPEYFSGVNVCDIGSLDINGNNHYLFSDYTYHGVDIGRGRNVNFISKGHEFKPVGGVSKYDTVISTECFEHDMFWKETIQNIIDNLVKPGGMFLFTCASTGRPEHGTPRTSPSDSPFTVQVGEWSTYYQNLTEADIKYAIDLDKYFKFYRFYVNTISCDLYFWGILKD